MMVTLLRCWWQNHYVGDFVRYVGDVFNVQNLSPILALLTAYRYQIGHQHKLSPTSVTRINVASFVYLFAFELFAETEPNQLILKC